LAESVTVDVPEPGAGRLVWLKAAVTPAGRPPAVSEIAELKPSKTAVAMVDVPELPAATVSDVGLACIEKFAWLPDHGDPPVKSLVRVVEIDDMIAGSEIISPSSRFLVRDAFEKFSEPMKTDALGLP